MVSDELAWQVNMDDDFKKRILEKYKRFNDECARAAREFLDEGRKILMGSASSLEVFPLLLQEWQSGITRSILAESRKGYDAVVVGRRGLGKVEGLLLGSVSTKVVQGVDRVPVWIVGRGEPSPKMLIAVDSSENSRKAVNAAAPFAAETGGEIALCHVVRKFFAGFGSQAPSAFEEIENQLKKSLRSKIQSMFDEYAKCLETAGVSPARIRTVCSIGSPSRAAEILSTAREGGYGTIVMGRRGISMVQEFLMGRVTNKVLNGADELTVWVVP
jgi:nucleotide-binding universal stress UspA family protein